MLVKIKQSKSEKILLIFLILLAFFSFSSFFLIKNKCFFVKKVNLEKLSFKYPENILVMNINCGNVVIELMPEISPNAVKRFKTLVSNKEYDDVAFYRVVEGGHEWPTKHWRWEYWGNRDVSTSEEIWKFFSRI